MTAFDDWLRRAWPGGPPNWDPSYLRELYEDDCRRTAQARAERAESKELAQLLRRVAELEDRQARVEKILGPGGKTISNNVGKAVGQVMPRFFEQQFEKYGALYDAGIWSDQKEYRPGALVSHRGVSWTCKIASRGLRPGDGNGGWRMIDKGK